MHVSIKNGSLISDKILDKRTNIDFLSLLLVYAPYKIMFFRKNVYLFSFPHFEKDFIVSFSV